jgi:hypothetical protein
MIFNIMTLMLAGAMYMLALALKSTSLRSFSFRDIIKISNISSTASRTKRTVGNGLLLISLALFVWLINHTINSDRIIFFQLLGLGIVLVIIRLSGFLFPRISILGLEIEIDPDSKFNLLHLRRSPFIIGGVALILLGGLSPLILEGVLHWRFSTYLRAERQTLEQERIEFNKKYQKRWVRLKERWVNEDVFFELLKSHNRFVIQGKAGVGKSWFLTSMRFHFYDHHPEETIIFMKAYDISTNKGGIIKRINSRIFHDFNWFSLPYTKRILADRSTMILIDGLDEVTYGERDKFAGMISKFSEKNEFKRNTVVVTTRPVGIAFPNTYERIELQGLTKDEAIGDIGRRNGELYHALNKHLQGHGGINYGLLKLLNYPQAFQLSAVDQEQAGRIYYAFLNRFGFLTTTSSPDGTMKMPLLSTYRDLDIVQELFLDALFGKIQIPLSSSDEARLQLFEHYLRKKIQMNCLSKHDKAISATVCDDAIALLTSLCESNTLRHPQPKTFKFTKDDLKGNLGNITRDTLFLEAEIFVEDGTEYVFENPLLASYFIEKLQRMSR